MQQYITRTMHYLRLGIDTPSRTITITWASTSGMTKTLPLLGLEEGRMPSAWPLLPQAMTFLLDL